MYSPTASSIGRTREASTDWMMFGFYIRNNIGVAFQCFAGGLFAGVGTRVLPGLQRRVCRRARRLPHRARPVAHVLFLRRDALGVRAHRHRARGLRRPAPGPCAACAGPPHPARGARGRVARHGRAALRRHRDAASWPLPSKPSGRRPAGSTPSPSTAWRRCVGPPSSPISCSRAAVQVDALAIRLRPRSPLEAADFGVRLCQSAARSVSACYAAGRGAGASLLAAASFQIAQLAAGPGDLVAEALARSVDPVRPVPRGVRADARRRATCGARGARCGGGSWCSR